MSDEKILRFRQNDTDELDIDDSLRARVAAFEDEEELCLHFEIPETDCAITIRFAKGVSGDNGKATVIMREGLNERRLSNVSIDSFRQWVRNAVSGAEPYSAASAASE